MKRVAPLEARLPKILKTLEKTYPNAHCELDFTSPLELLVSVILSAQCTDRRVNLVTPALFRKYRTAAEYAGAPRGELEGLIRSTGFFRSKAKSIQGACRILVDRHGGKVPAGMEALLELPGVGRKTANVILGTAYGITSGVVVDTHMTRLARRFGMTRQTDPVKIEKVLMKLIPKDRWMSFSHEMVWHGRRLCYARKPDCLRCPLLEWCPAGQIYIRHGAAAAPAN